MQAFTKSLHRFWCIHHHKRPHLCLHGVYTYKCQHQVLCLLVTLCLRWAGQSVKPLTPGWHYRPLAFVNYSLQTSTATTVYTHTLYAVINQDVDWHQANSFKNSEYQWPKSALLEDTVKPTFAHTHFGKLLISWKLNILFRASHTHKNPDYNSYMHRHLKRSLLQEISLRTVYKPERESARYIYTTYTILTFATMNNRKNIIYTGGQGKSWMEGGGGTALGTWHRACQDST